jgi:plastocyanin
MKLKKIAALVAGACAALLGGTTFAGGDLVKYPANYLKGDLYGTVDRNDNKQYRELYASPGVVDAVKGGKPVPSGAVLTLVAWSTHQDDKGNPLLGPGGRFIKKDIVAINVMEKRTGWGKEYPDSLRNGEWEYQSFNPQGVVNAKANLKGCFECHKPHDKLDYVLTLSKLEGKFPGQESLAKAPKGDVNIVSFAFAPAKFTGTAGKPIKFLNSDNSPHWIAVQGSDQKTPVMVRGQTASITLPAGTYGYICGLHPSMKGAIEVK